MIDEERFGQRLENCMKQAKISNTELTRRLNISKNAVGNYKNNQIPNAAILYNISQILGTTMEYLLTGKDISELTNEEKKIMQAYRKASKDSREIVNLALKPYMENEKVTFHGVGK